MKLRSFIGDLRRRALCRVYQRSVPIEGHGPIVSFTFDDFPRTAASTAGRMLEDFGARGTYYVAFGLMNVSNGLGDMFHDGDLHDLLQRGHELGTQTFAHSSARNVSQSEFRKDVEKGVRALEEFTNTPAPNFCYPYGHVTLRTKRALGPSLGSSRSIFPGLNGPDADLNLLRANRLYGDTDECQRIRTLIEENVRRRSWLIFFTHDVRQRPSEYGCTPELFESVVSEAAKSGSRILTVGEALRNLAAIVEYPEVEHGYV